MYKVILPIIDLDIIVVIFLVVILHTYKTKFKMDEKINKTYVYLIITTTIIIILEILDKILLLHHSTILVPITKIINIIGFGLYPISAFLWMIYLLQYFNLEPKSKLIIMPLIINFAISLLSYKYGFIFEVNNLNIYSRGTFFFTSIIITYFYFITSLIIIFKNKEKTEDKEYINLIMFEAIPFIAAIIQIFFNNLLLIWGSVGISLVIHYIYIQEKLLRYDNLTGVWNRMTSELYIYNNFINKNRPFSLIYVDVNDFKLINDTYGHNEGDKALINIANFLKNYFKDIGKVGRMGGDEFIIIIYKENEIQVNSIIRDINLQLCKYNIKLNKSYKLTISTGYKKFYNNYSRITDYIKDIDELMYINKQKIKKKLH
ncbi:GGDEF domain-containing protein [Terrisporobacter mayombei]|uniref:GGDEF domain-containing protein n=1 Tax=Terrisporobacter mayombei TaxID=1541 RepID=UPI001D1647BE|nr:GGDEF domain-containing protein [Terrisporobacter mayombei]MCC3867411.1 GGDEF domain-containing protein [Terrisporobacter mayombei]